MIRRCLLLICTHQCVNKVLVHVVGFGFLISLFFNSGMIAEVRADSKRMQTAAYIETGRNQSNYFDVH